MVGTLVADCSVAAAWLLEDEVSAETDALLDQASHYGALVPAIWFLEMANMLLNAARRKRVLPAKIPLKLRAISKLPVETDKLPPEDVYEDIFLLAERHGLTVYDAAYLELAAREGLPLATRDAALRKAAKKLGIRVLPS